MKRLAIFAHYDRDAVIDEYVIRYLDGLRTVAQRILFISDGDLAPTETAKLGALAEFVPSGRHAEYDYGSWKRGIAHFRGALTECDELILANDSCYAPIFPFEDAFARMARVPCDAWGMTGYRDREGLKFINSYYLVFRRPVLDDPSFVKFWTDIAPRNDKQDVVADYEMGLSRMLLAQGHRLATLVPPDMVDLPVHGDYVRRLMVEYRAPCLKVSLFRDNPTRVPRLGETLAGIDHFYPRRLIDAHQRRLTKRDDPPNYHFRLGAFRWSWRGRLLHVFGRTRHDRWWKLYVQVLGVTVFAFVLPLARRQ
jgi:lipopolysaccharide biosynthesis protein